jgi:hypothetical protein
VRVKKYLRPAVRSVLLFCVWFGVVLAVGAISEALARMLADGVVAVLLALAGAWVMLLIVMAGGVTRHLGRARAHRRPVLLTAMEAQYLSVLAAEDLRTASEAQKMMYAPAVRALQPACEWEKDRP